MSRTQQLVEMSIDETRLEGELVVPPTASGIVLFAHGSGSSRHSPRNNAVAERLQEAGLGTLLFDLLTEEEDVVRSARFDIPMLTGRLAAVSQWVAENDGTSTLTQGYFGASTGAAAALRAAVRDGTDVDAIVSRGGRVDMASAVAEDVTAPCLFIVGSEDTEVLELNEEVLARLNCEKRLEVIEGAGHLFEGPGQLDEVADLAAEWFSERLT